MAGSALRYAAYGSNLHPVRLRARIPSAELVGTGCLRGYRLRFHKKGIDGSAKCGIVPGDGSVYLAVYSIDAAERADLDTFEHAGIGYDAVTVEVPDYGDCLTYRATETYIVDGLAPYCWYHEMVIRGCELHGFPREYIARLRNVDRVRDPDRDRRRRNWDIITAMEDLA